MRRLLLLIFLPAFLLACNAESPTEPSDQSGPSLQIQDALHNGGNPHFFWLAPLVGGDPPATEEFDATAEMTIRICKWAGANCVETIGEFSNAPASTDGDIEVNIGGEFYQALWHTNDVVLEAGSVYRILAFGSGQQLGFLDIQVVDSGRELKSVNQDEYVPFLDDSNRTLPIRFRVENGAILEWVDISPTRSPTNEDLFDVWGSSSSDVFAVGAAGTVLHYDGSTWQTQASGSTADLFGVWGSSATNVYAVGNEGKVIHYDGSSWTPVSVPVSVILKAVWGSSASDIYAVGFDGNVLHFDGSAWTVTQVPYLDDYGEIAGYTDFWDVWGSSPDQILVVGQGHGFWYDGQDWVEEFSLYDYYRAVTGLGPTEIYAAGGPAGTLLRRFDGTKWNSVQLEDSGSPEDLFDVWVAPDSEILVAGHGLSSFAGSMATIGSGDRNAVVLRHFPPLAIYALWGESSEAVYAVGTNGTVLRYDGAEWRAELVGPADLRAIWGTAPGEYVVVGVGDNVYHGITYHYGGDSWYVEEVYENNTRYDVWGASPTDIYSVGTEWETSILKFDGTEWKRSANPDTKYGVGGSSGSNVFACGYRFAMSHFDGANWQEEESIGIQNLGYCQAIWSDSPSDVFAVGDDGTILEFDGTVWTQQASGTTANLTDVWGSSPDNVLAVGEAFLRYDGASWTAEPGVDRAAAVFGTSADNVYAVNGSDVLFYNGVTWTAFPTGALSDLVDVWTSTSGDIVVIGTDGLVLQAER